MAIAFRTSDWGSRTENNYYGPGKQAFIFLQIQILNNFFSLYHCKVTTEYPNQSFCAFKAFRADAGQPDEYQVRDPKMNMFNKIVKMMNISTSLTKPGFMFLLQDWDLL